MPSETYVKPIQSTSKPARGDKKSGAAMVAGEMTGVGLGLSLGFVLDRWDAGSFVRMRHYSSLTLNTAG